MAAIKLSGYKSKDTGGHVDRTYEVASWISARVNTLVSVAVWRSNASTDANVSRMTQVGLYIALNAAHAPVRLTLAIA